MITKNEWKELLELKIKAKATTYDALKSKYYALKNENDEWCKRGELIFGSYLNYLDAIKEFVNF